MADQTHLQKLFTAKGFSDHCWIDPHEIVVARWVRMKYLYGCTDFGSASCPADPPSLEECRAFFDEYRLGALFHISKPSGDPDELHGWSREVNRALLDLEHGVISAGYGKAFLIFMDSCNLCRECATGRAGCRNKKLARPYPEGLGVDIAATVAKYGFDAGAAERQERFAILLIE